MTTQSRRTPLLRLLALMGPAFVVGAWQFGPGNLASAVQAGSRFGYSLIWVIAVSTLLMIMFTDMSIRIAVSSRGSHMEGTVALKLGLKARGVLPSATVRSPLRDLSADAERQIVRALASADLI